MKNLIASAVLFALTMSALALTESTTEHGVHYVMGGITQEELVEINRRRPLFNVSVLTVARPSGAYLSDVRLVIAPMAVARANGTPTIDVVMEGPWLLTNLAPGQYEVTATFEGKAERQRVAVVIGRDRQLIFRFPSDDQVSPDLKPSATQ